MKFYLISFLTLIGFMACKMDSANKSKKSGFKLGDCDPSVDKNCHPTAGGDGGFVENDGATTSTTSKGEPDPSPSPSPTPNDPNTPTQNTPTQSTTSAGTTGSTPTPTATAKVCSASTIQYIRGNGNCAKNWAAFAADDNKYYVLACCPLPKDDILTSDAPVARGGLCLDGEVAVGVASQTGLVCAKINTAKYKLSAAAKTCYVGGGASGGSGTSKCVSTPALAMSMVSTFGSDACLPNPFGGLIVQRTSKYCRDVKASSLLNKDTGAVIPMF